MRFPIYTIGYERASVPEFLSALSAAGIQVVVDVRAIAHSRRPGFAKTALKTHLQLAGITYWHIPSLGNPKAGRMAAWSGDEAGFHAIFLAHLTSAEPMKALQDLALRASDVRVCLLCMEAEPERCHRSLVADALHSSQGLSIEHLFPAAVHAGAG